MSGTTQRETVRVGGQASRDARWAGKFTSLKKKLVVRMELPEDL
jgi:hypothetical protein